MAMLQSLHDPSWPCYNYYMIPHGHVTTITYYLVTLVSCTKQIECKNINSFLRSSAITDKSGMDLQKGIHRLLKFI